MESRVDHTETSKRTRRNFWLQIFTCTWIVLESKKKKTWLNSLLLSNENEQRNGFPTVAASEKKTATESETSSSPYISIFLMTSPNIIFTINTILLPRKWTNTLIVNPSRTYFSTVEIEMFDTFKYISTMKTTVCSILCPLYLLLL